MISSPLIPAKAGTQSCDSFLEFQIKLGKSENLIQGLTLDGNQGLGG